ncbi:MAG: glycosyltransferase family 2 protein [Selenomonadaceae bacterium]|nr:glycosyltransferase family 2 protein [Selenomonadaceae bacterium]
MADKFAVTVIVPMYNVEKYIEPCLRSLLEQTVRDFEVIVVDDCSTDRSPSIVNGLSAEFNGRLTLLKMKKNNGAPGLPRNLALKSARGKYVSFLDSDDLLMPTALEELISIAESTAADVLHSEQFYAFDEESDELRLNSWEVGNHVKRPTLETNDIGRRIDGFCNRQFNWSSCLKFFRREFLIKNRIEFPSLPYSEDMPFSFKCLCSAKTYVRIPNIFYKCRYRQGSLQHRSVTPEQLIKTYLRVIVEGVQVLDKFMEAHPFFADVENHGYRYQAIGYFIREHCSYFDEVYQKYPAPLIDILNREALEPMLGKQAALVSYLFNAVNVGGKS